MSSGLVQLRICLVFSVFPNLFYKPYVGYVGGFGAAKDLVGIFCFSQLVF